MAFIPVDQKRFYLVPKHSRKGYVLGLSNSSYGQVLHLQIIAEKHELQSFTFDNEGSIFWMMPNYKETYLAVHNASNENHSTAHPVPIIQWKWENGKEHLKFRMVPAGGGYYRIMAVHSGKYFDVFEAKDEIGAIVVQHELMESENQLFMPVPVPIQDLTTSPVSLVKTNELMRTATIGLLGQVPEIGGGLKFIVGFFWTEPDKLGDLWNQMKVYVDMRIRQYVHDKELHDLGLELAGIMNAMNVIDLSAELTKSNMIEALLLDIAKIEPKFYGREDDTLPFLIGIGTIVITVCRMMVVNYAVLYGRPITPTVLAANQLALETAIAKYIEKVRVKRLAIIETRMGKINDRVTIKRDGTGTIPRDSYTSEAKDKYDDWSQSWVHKSGTNNYTDHEHRADHAVTQRRNQVREQFESEMEALLRQTELWPHFNPNYVPVQKVATIRAVGSFGGAYGHQAFNGQDNKRITKIKVHSRQGGNVCGLEVFYDAVSDGLKGVAGHESSIELGANDFITSAYGYAYDIIGGLWFTTSKGRIIGGGPSGGGSLRFVADLSDNLNAKLVKISGAYNNDTIEQLTFHWKYDPYVVAQPVPAQIS